MSIEHLYLTWIATRHWRGICYRNDVEVRPADLTDFLRAELDPNTDFFTIVISLAASHSNFLFWLFLMLSTNGKIKSLSIFDSDFICWPPHIYGIHCCTLAWIYFRMCIRAQGRTTLKVFNRTAWQLQVQKDAVQNCVLEWRNTRF